MKVREANQSDFDGIYNLLRKLNDTRLSKTDWKRITKVDFNTNHSHYGYVLENEGEILGFIGTIFSKRNINGAEVNFCNFHSWIVDPIAKTGGMALLLKVLKLKKFVITNFTASEGPYKIFQGLKFHEVAYTNYKFLPLQSSKSKSKVEVKKVNDSNAETLLDQEQLQLYKDHKEFENVQFLNILIDGSSAFVISKKRIYDPIVLQKIPLFKKLTKNKLFLGNIHYISNPDVFFSGFAHTKTALKICRLLGVVGIIVADRYLQKTNTLRKKLYPSKRPYFYKHADDDHLIDTLYSEFFVLNF